MARLRMFLLCLMLLIVSAVSWGQGVRAVVTSEFGNVRLIPALGAEVLGSAPAGFVFEIVNGRSADGQWLRVDYFGQEGWINITPIAILQGDINSLPVADPRSIPYGGFESPRAGQSGALGPVAARATDNLRIRSGPSRAYPTLGSIFTNQGMTLTGRTASNGWYQVSYEGLLGWVSSQYVAILSGDVNALPVDGIVADAPARTDDSEDTYIGVLRQMLDRINLAQPSLDTIRAYWADSALTGRAACRPYPAQPSDIQIATPVLAAYYATLEPLRVDFNDAMFNVRKAILLFIEVCNQPGTGNPVGQATVEGALGVVNLAQTQFDNLRARLAALIPASPGANECLLSFNGRTEILPVIALDTVYVDEFTARDYATGYCFDAAQGQSLNVQTLPFPDSNAAIFIAISALDSPTNFLAVNRTSANTRLSVGPIVIPRTTRYVLIVADLNQDGGAPPRGKFAVLISNLVNNIVANYLTYNTDTNAIELVSDPAVPIYKNFEVLLALTQTLTSSQLTPTPFGGTPPASAVCPSTSFTCNQLFTCQEAQACLAAGNFLLDTDNDGIPCEGTLPQSCPISGTADNP